MNWLRRIFSDGQRPAPKPPPHVLPSTQRQNPAEMSVVGIHMLKELLAWCNWLDRVNDIETVHEEADRTVVQVMPLRAEVFDLDSAIGKMHFEMRCDRSIDPRQVFAVGTYRGEQGLYGVFAYSPLSLVEDCDFEPGDLASARYDGAADWDRLRDHARQHDLAYSLDWLKRLYLETFQMLAELAIQRKNSLKFARRLSVLRDVTFMETIERMVARMQGHEGVGEFKKILAVFAEAYAGAEREHGALRDNPLVWLAYASTSRYFACFRGALLERQFVAWLQNGAILQPHIEQARDLIDLAVECLTEEQAADARPLLNIVIACMRLIDAPSLAGYVLMTSGAFEMHVGAPPDLDRALSLYREARDIFKNLPDATTELDAARLNIKRIGALKGASDTDSGPSIAGRRFSPDEAAVVSKYSELVAEGRAEEAIETLDEVAERVQGAERIEIESLSGLLLLKLNRLPEAYKRLNRCQHLLSKGTGEVPETGTFEIFESGLLFQEGSSRQAASVAAEALARLEHVCPLSNRIMLATNLSAAQLDFDLSAAEQTASKYERQADGIDRVFLLSNLSAAKVERDPIGAEQVARGALDMLEEGGQGHNDLQFDLYFRLAQTALQLRDDPSAVVRGLEACERALTFVNLASDSKLRNLFHVQAQLLESQMSGAEHRREALESGFVAAEHSFLAIARVEDDIHHQVRLLSGYFAKVGTFEVFGALFNIYRSSESWHAAMAHAQRFKSRFLIEAALAVSENMCARRGAETFAKSLKDGDSDFVKALQLAVTAKQVNEQAWQQAVKAMVKDKLEVEPEFVLRPISFEQAEPMLHLLSASDSAERQGEYEKIIDYGLSAKRLPAHTVLLEMVPLGDRIGVLALCGDGELGWVQEYAPHQSALTSEPSDVDSSRTEAFAELASDLERVVPADTAALVICPCSWAWSVPFSAVRTGSGWLADRYRIVLAPSAAFHSLTSARTRRFAEEGFALIDPRHELQWADHEIVTLGKQGAVRFGTPCNTALASDSLRESAKGKYWIHLSAHGNSDGTRLGLNSGLSLYEHEEPGADAALGLADVLMDPFPGVDCGVAVLSACHAAEASTASEEPLGVATSLLVGGAKAVVAPLWEVDEFATLLFFNHFYAHVARARVQWLSEVVRDAQNSLRSMQAADVVGELEKAGAAGRPAAHGYLRRIRQELDESGCPYSAPYYWAAFVVVGTDVRLPAL